MLNNIILLHLFCRKLAYYYEISIFLRCESFNQSLNSWIILKKNYNDNMFQGFYLDKKLYPKIKCS